MRGLDDHLDNYGSPGINDDEPDIEVYRVVVDGIPWIDPDGNDQFYESEAQSIAESCARQGYTSVEVEEV